MSNDSNTNIINRRDRKTLNMKCFKLNPPVYENIKVKRREALNNPTPFLKIDNLTNYFNLQTFGQIQYEGKTGQIKRNNLNEIQMEYVIKTSLLAVVPPYVNILNDLYTRPTIKDMLPVSKWIGVEQIVLGKKLNVQRNCGNKELFNNVILAQRTRTNIARFNTNYGVNVSQDEQLPPIIPADLINMSNPIFCYEACENCIALCKFDINEIDLKGQPLILEELSKHNHLQYRKINKKVRNLKQAKDELKNHYLKYHLPRMDNSSLLPNTSTHFKSIHYLKNTAVIFCLLFS